MNTVMTVSQLNRYMAFKLKEDANLRGILIRGEISGFVNHAKTGHFYFTIKDSASAVKAIMFNSFASRLSFMPHNGMSVIASASVQVFERDGVYQLYVTDMQPDGIGAVFLAAEQLKHRLAEEGLFDERYKQPIPKFPSKIGIVTSKDAAALRDILNILSRRYPVCEAVIFPCLVQGEYAYDSICEALELADKSGCDVIICGRGGGSPEDLMAFNSEKVARTAFAVNTPLISAVGHETDTTIIDFVADLRAPTPSAAAELAVPDISVLRSVLDGCMLSLTKALGQTLAKKRSILSEREQQLNALYPAADIERCTDILEQKTEFLRSAALACLEKKSMTAAAKAAELEALSPLRVMARGYSLVYGSSGLIKSSDKLKSGDELTLRFSDGTQAEAVVK